MAAVVPDGGTALTQRCPAALAPARAIQGEIAPRLESNPLTASVWQRFQQAPAEQAAWLANALALLLAADAALARRLDALLAQYQQATASSGGPQTNIAGNVTGPVLSGQFQGPVTVEQREIHTGGGDYYGQVEVGGDFVRGHQTKVIGNGNVVGDGTTHQGLSADEVARLFAVIADQVARRADLPPADRADLQAELQEVQAEVAKGEQADESALARRLRNIKRMAPDILDVVLATFTNPPLGLLTVCRKVAERLRADAGWQ